MTVKSTFIGIIVGTLALVLVVPNVEATPKKPKSSTDKRIKKQKKHQKKHPCPQIDC